MHGTELCKQERRTFRLFAPQQPFCQPPDQRIKARRRLLPTRDLGLVAAFPSPVTNAPCGASIPGSTALACYFAPWLIASTARSALLLRCLNRFAPAPAASTLLARCGFPDVPGWLRPLPPLPFRTFASLQIKASAGVAACQARLPNSPDFPSLPAADIYY